MGTDKNQAGRCLGKPSGATFSNPFTSELARDYEITSPSRSASGPAFSRLARDIGNGKEKDTGLRLACQDGGVLEKHLKARLRVSFPK